jgi:hypothetical protein
MSKSSSYYDWELGFLELPLPKGSGFVIHRELLLNLLIQ